MVNYVIDEINERNEEFHCKLMERKNNVSVIRCDLNEGKDVHIFFGLFE